MTSGKPSKDSPSFAPNQFPGGKDEGGTRAKAPVKHKQRQPKTSEKAPPSGTCIVDASTRVSKAQLLRNEIERLGGDVQEDWVLLKDALSGSEVEEEDSDADDSALKSSSKPAKPSTVLAVDPSQVELQESALVLELEAFMRKENVDFSSFIDVNFEEEDESEDEAAVVVESKFSVRQSDLTNKVESANDDLKKGESATVKQASAQETSPETEQVKATIDPLCKSIMFDFTSRWYDVSLPILKDGRGKAVDLEDAKWYPSSKQHETGILTLYQNAKKAWENDASMFEKDKAVSSSHRDFITTVLRSGTTSDKLSAITLLIQESPLHTLSYLRDHLIHGMARKKSRREAVVAIDAIKDLFANTILPDRRLVYFRDQPLFAPGVKNIHLIAWYFEDSLKKLFFDFTVLLEEMLSDPLLHVKNKMLIHVLDLLSTKPEGESNLLALLVNKLGDQERNLASKAAYCLSQLLVRHPAMKQVVCREVFRMLFRPGSTDRSKYYAVTFLNQVILTRKEEDFANELLGIYFKLFDLLIHRQGLDKKEKGESFEKSKNPSSKKDAKDVKQQPEILDGVDAKMMAGILTGVNRAFPFAKLTEDLMEKNVNSIFKMIHIGSFNTCIQGLCLLFQVQSSVSSFQDRFYRALYESLLDIRLYTANKQAMYLNLLFKALKEDSSIDRVRAFIKRLIQTCGCAQVPFICASLFLSGQIANLKPGLWAMISVPEENDDVEIVPSADEGRVEPPTTRTLDNRRKYDGKKRDPSFANASNSCLWELIIFHHHYHPTIALYASTLLSGQVISPPQDAVNYDPLQNHTLVRFLDRFVYKNPKKVTTLYKGSSLMQPRANSAAVGDDTITQLFVGRKKGNSVFQNPDDVTIAAVALDDKPVNSIDWNAKSDVAPDEKFFYQFFKDKKKKTMKSKSTFDDDENDDAGLDLDDQDGGDDVDEPPVDENEENPSEIGDQEAWEAMLTSSGLPNPDESDVDAIEDEDLDIEYSDSGESAAADDDDGNNESVAYSDDDEDAIFSDIELEAGDELDGRSESDEDDEVQEEKSKTNEKVKGANRRSARAVQQMESKARSLGYKGNFFSSLQTPSAIPEFADASEFADLIDQYESEEGHDVSDDGNVAKKDRGSEGKTKVNFSKKRKVSPVLAEEGEVGGRVVKATRRRK